MDDKTLVKILEFGKISLGEALELISKTLSLEFYFDKDTSIYTLSSEIFVLDVENKKCLLIFVEEELNVKLKYIEKYLNYFIDKLDVFFFLLRYLSHCRSNFTNACINKKIISSHPFACDCIFTGDFCNTFDLSTIGDNFNIFTHSTFNYPLDLYLFNPDNLESQPISNSPENFAEIFSEEIYSKKIFNLFNHKGPFLYESNDVKVIDKDVYINKLRSKIASFAFLKGCTLKECLMIATNLE